MASTQFARFVQQGRKIVAVGRNYRDQVGAMKLPLKPLIFMRPPTCYIIEGQPIKIPRGCRDLQHEVELGVVIGKRATDVPEAFAMDCVAGYALALDMTAQDFLVEARREGLPWIFVKCFDTANPISPFIDRRMIRDPYNLNLWLKLNDQMRQSGNTRDMIFQIPFLISYISSFFTLEPCDLILTGTPKGASAVKAGDKIECGIEEVVSMTFYVENKEHAAELGNKIPESPLLFMKPASAYIIQGQTIKIPKGCINLHHEVELGVVISERATDVDESRAMDYVAGYALALDMTARDFQEDAKKKGLPWTFAKCFDTSNPISEFIDKDRVVDPHNLNLWCKVNGELRQNGNTRDMIFQIPFLISYISSFFTLEPCDLVLTGTPKGVGPVKAGDKIECGLADMIVMSFPVEQK